MVLIYRKISELFIVQEKKSSKRPLKKWNLNVQSFHSSYENRAFSGNGREKFYPNCAIHQNTISFVRRLRTFIPSVTGNYFSDEK